MSFSDIIRREDDAPGAEHLCRRTRVQRFILLSSGYVYYTRVKWLHASDPLMSAIHHRGPEKKSNNIAFTVTFTRVCAREMARSSVPHDDSQTYASTRSSYGDLFLLDSRDPRNSSSSSRRRREKGRKWNELWSQSDEFTTIVDYVRETMEVGVMLVIEIDNAGPSVIDNVQP